LKVVSRPEPLARHERLDRDVALKLMTPEPSAPHTT
jgi:hypothetical protein